MDRSRDWACVRVGMVALVGYGLFTLLRLALQGFDPSSFVLASEFFCDRAHAPQALTIYPNAAGYDGQFYYRLALNPFTTQETEFGITLDAPAWRQQRILYPLLAHILSFGDPRATLWVLIGLNLAGLGAIAWLGARIARDAGLSPWWGLAFAVYPGFVITLSRDLTEITAAAFLLAGFHALRRERAGWAAAAWSLAVLSRETTLLAPGALAMVELWRRARGGPRGPMAAWVAPISVFAVFQCILLVVWEERAIASGRLVLSLPLWGFVESMVRDGAQGGAHAVFWSIQRTLVLAYVVAVTWRTRSRGDAHVWLAFILYALLGATAGPVIWEEDKGFLRALTELYVIGMFLLMTGPGRLRACFTAAWGAVWAVTILARLELHH